MKLLLNDLIEEVVIRIFLYVELTDFLIKHLTKLVDILLVLGRNEKRRRHPFLIPHFSFLIYPRHPGLLQFVKRDILLRRLRQVILVLRGPRVGIYLVEHQHGRFLGTPQVGKCLLNHTDLLLEIGMGNVHHMYQQVSLANLVEG